MIFLLSQLLWQKGLCLLYFPFLVSIRLDLLLYSFFGEQLTAILPFCESPLFETLMKIIVNKPADRICDFFFEFLVFLFSAFSYV